tara:strand:+ start:1985 stop:2155 length:171 start_codon:yes stop_codon:yes gene_type:complete
MTYFFLIGVIVFLLIVNQNDVDEYNSLIDDYNCLIEDRDYYKNLVNYWNDHEWYDT